MSEREPVWRRPAGQVVEVDDVGTHQVEEKPPEVSTHKKRKPSNRVRGHQLKAWADDELMALFDRSRFRVAELISGPDDNPALVAMVLTNYDILSESLRRFLELTEEGEESVGGSLAGDGAPAV